jgi:hypothetical protein
MAFAQDCGSGQSSVALRPSDRLTLGLVGMGVIFASLGLGEAVYRFAFFDFDGATDRLPIKLLFGLAFAWMTTKLAIRIYQYRMETSARITLIRDRNYKPPLSPPAQRLTQTVPRSHRSPSPLRPVRN